MVLMGTVRANHMLYERLETCCGEQNEYRDAQEKAISL